MSQGAVDFLRRPSFLLTSPYREERKSALAFEERSRSKAADRSVRSTQRWPDTDGRSPSTLLRAGSALRFQAI